MTAESRLELRATSLAQVIVALFLLTAVLAMIVVGGLGMRIVAVAMFGAYIWLCVMMSRRRLIIDANGITRRATFGSETTIAWSEVDHYTYWSMGQQNLYVGAGGVAGAAVVAIALAVMSAFGRKGANRTFRMGELVVRSKDGRKIALGTGYRNVADGLDLAFEHLHGHLRARPRDYAPFALTDTELSHTKKGTLSLADIDKVNTAQAYFMIRKRGKRLAWTKVHMKRVKNVMLLVEDLAERGLVIDAQSEVFVPPPVLEKLRAASARQAALPRAEIRRR